MKVRSLLVIISFYVFGVFFSVNAAERDSKFSIGINYDYQFLKNDLKLDTLLGIDQGGHFIYDGFGYAHRIGINMSLPITNYLCVSFNPQFVLNNLNIDTLSNIYYTHIDNSIELDTVTYREALNYKSNYIQSMLGLEINPIDNILLNFNGFFIYSIYDELNVYQKITETNNRKQDYFKNEEKTRDTNLKNESYFSKESFGISGKISYSININQANTIKIIPYISFDYNLNNVLGNTNWKNYGISAGFSINFDFGNDLKNQKPEPLSLSKLLELSGTASDMIYGDFLKYQYSDTNSIEFKNIKEQFESNILLNLKINSVDELGVETSDPKIETEEIISENSIPLLNYIFFKDNSSIVPSRYNLNKSEFLKNKKNNYSNNTLKLYSDILNILGERLSKTNSKIEIIGYNSGVRMENNNSQLSKERAIAVSSYLKQKWNIDKNRIKISGSNLPPKPSNINDPLGEEENRRVEIISNDWEIVKPVQLQDTILDYKNAVLRIYPNITTNKKINNKWIEISVDKNRIDSIPVLKTNNYIDWDSKKILNKNKTIKEINFILCAETSEKTIIRSENIVIEVKTKTLNDKILNKLSDKRMDRFQLILFDFNKFEINNHNKKISNLIIKKLKDSSEVKITGYTDMIGDEKVNKELSEKRAKALATILSLKTIVPFIRGMGETNLFDNKLPEGRFYSRTVITEILSPIHW
jgi:outer membrane protein OmpA-like peptidoglycan-associated protein